MIIERLSKEECERIRTAFVREYTYHPGFRSCSVRYDPFEGNWIRCGVADITSEEWPEEFEGIPVWIEEVDPAIYPTLPPQ